MVYRVEVKAKEVVITDLNRMNREDTVALDEALQVIRAEALALMARRGQNRGDSIHLSLYIERDAVAA